jgi:spore coat polysaccharide biosynthesis protein SpsF (cytidylyltransferase family)
MKVVAILQARSTSTRLPGKVLMEIAGKTMLERVFERVSAAQTVNEVVVATTEDPSDDQLMEFCSRIGVPAIRGSLNDVLSRFIVAADATQADIIVRVTTDCPLADPELIDEVVNRILKGDCDYVSNRLPPDPRSIPIGLDVEAVTYAALKTADEEAQLTPEREHVTPFIYNRQDVFRCVHLEHPEIGHGEDRWTVDTPEDMEFVRALTPFVSSFSWRDTFRAIEALSEPTS